MPYQRNPHLFDEKHCAYAKMHQELQADSWIMLLKWSANLKAGELLCSMDLYIRGNALLKSLICIFPIFWLIQANTFFSVNICRNEAQMCPWPE